RRHGGKRSWKSLLQLVCHRDLETEPVYRLERRRGPDHAPEFEVAVEIAGRRYGAGSAGSRKEAEQRAAEATLRILLGRAFDAVARGAEPRLEGPPPRGAG
ncbi:MAG: hypothetical protein D6776_04460, partial [Planctomycetota bacterium]